MISSNNNTLFIINPTAGNGNGKNFYEKYIKSESKKGIVSFLTEFPGHAIALAREHASNFKNLIIVGGDGTVNEVFNGLDTLKSINIGIIPIGTGNDFAKNVGYKIKKIETLLNKFLNEVKSTITFQVYNAEFSEADKENLIRQRKFVNAIGIGFDALVASIVNKKIKKGGILAYIQGVFEALKSLQYLEIEESSFIKNKNIDKFLITLGNTKTSGGGFYLSPHANFNKKELAITIIDKISKTKIVRALPLALFNLIHLVKEVSLLKAEEVYIKFAQPTVCHCDGEIISEQLKSLRVKSVEHNFKLII